MRRPLNSLTVAIGLALVSGCLTSHPCSSAPPAAGCPDSVATQRLLADKPLQRCTLRVSHDRLLLDGVQVELDTAVERCRQSREAVVILDKDASEEEWRRVEHEFRRACVQFHLRGEIGDFRQQRHGIPFDKVRKLTPRE